MGMGGFTYGIDEEGERVDFDDFKRLLGLTFSEYRSRYMNIARLPFPMITAAEICDKARGDFFSKAIFILQSLWFIFQCIARGKNKVSG